jgi:hypothetical protein
MRSRSSWILAVPLSFAGLLVGLMLGRPAPGQQPAPAAEPGPIGRYQISAGGTAGGGFYVAIDTVTGHAWFRTLGSQWIDNGNPFAPKK